MCSEITTTMYCAQPPAAQTDEETDQQTDTENLLHRATVTAKTS